MAAKKFDALLAGLPVAADAERFLIGLCLIHDRMEAVSNVLKADDFGQENHRVLWATMRAVQESGTEVNFSTVLMRLSQRQDDIERIGGLGYLAELRENLPNIANIEPYVREMRDKSVRRRLILKCNESMLRLSEPGEDAAIVASELADEAVDAGMTIADRRGFSTPHEAIAEAGGLDGYLRHRSEDGVQYPWDAMNRLTGGMRPGNLIVIAGPPGGGKTAMALNVAYHAASRMIGTAIFSLEMDREEITDRMISIAGRLDGRVLRKNMTDGQRQSIRAAVKALDIPFYIRDETNPSVRSVRAELKRLKAKEPIGIAIVDYIQLVEAQVRKGGSRAEDVGTITRGLKRLAKELKIPVIALSQLNRDSARDGKPPELHHLRESGSIEQDASLVGMIHYTRKYDTSAGVDTGDCNLLIRKHRNGPEGVVSLTFHAPSGRFYEMSEERE